MITFWAEFLSKSFVELSVISAAAGRRPRKPQLLLSYVYFLCLHELLLFVRYSLWRGQGPPTKIGWFFGAQSVSEAFLTDHHFLWRFSVWPHGEFLPVRGAFWRLAGLPSGIGPARRPLCSITSWCQSSKLGTPACPRLSPSAQRMSMHDVPATAGGALMSNNHSKCERQWRRCMLLLCRYPTLWKSANGSPREPRSLPGDTWFCHCGVQSDRSALERNVGRASIDPPMFRRSLWSSCAAEKSKFVGCSPAKCRR